jgi:hypothetical protein
MSRRKPPSPEPSDQKPIKVINQLTTVVNEERAAALFRAMLWGTRSARTKRHKEHGLCLFPHCEAPAVTTSSGHPWVVEGERFGGTPPYWEKLRGDLHPAAACEQCAQRAKAMPGLPCYCNECLKKLEPLMREAKHKAGSDIREVTGNRKKREEKRK